MQITYSHNRACKGASLGLAVSDEEGAVPPPPQQLLCLLPSHTANIPTPLFLVGIICQGVRARYDEVVQLDWLRKNI